MVDHPTTSSVRDTRPRLGLTRQILIGLLAGIAVGIFFGEYCAVFKAVGQAFIGLLQMTVLPYITIALIANIGRLSVASSRRFAICAIGVLLFFWLLAIVGLVVMPWAFPEWRSAAFFSTSLLKPPSGIDFVELFIPANPFHALANNIIPAVVLFSICLGAAIIGMKHKRAILDQLDFLTRALGRVNSFVVRLTPYGIFAIAADTAGTLSITEFGRSAGVSGGLLRGGGRDVLLAAADVGGGLYALQLPRGDGRLTRCHDHGLCHCQTVCCAAAADRTIQRPATSP